MLTLILTFSLGGSIGFLLGCVWKDWIESRALLDVKPLRESS